jgi:hypothetical protein
MSTALCYNFMALQIAAQAAAGLRIEVSKMRDHGYVPGGPWRKMPVEGLRDVYGWPGLIGSKWEDPEVTLAERIGLVVMACELRPHEDAQTVEWNDAIGHCLEFAIRVAAGVGVPLGTRLRPEVVLDPTRWTGGHQRLARLALSELCQQVFARLPRDQQLLQNLVNDRGILTALLELFRVGYHSGFAFFPCLAELSSDQAVQARRVMLAVCEEGLGFDRPWGCEPISMTPLQLVQPDALETLAALDGLFGLLDAQRYRLLTPMGWGKLEEVALMPLAGHPEPFARVEEADRYGARAARVYLGLKQLQAEAGTQR